MKKSAEVLREFAPPVVSFHFGLPAPALVDLVKSWGAKVLSSATTVTEAKWLAEHGADAIIAQGLEAGGHRGHFLSTDTNDQPGTMALLPQIVDAVKIPVIAAGGITDARAVTAALALGAAGVQVGTSYLLCPEATTSAVHRAALKESRASHTVLTNLFSGGLARGIPNRLIDELGAGQCDRAPVPACLRRALAFAGGRRKAGTEATSRRYGPVRMSPDAGDTGRAAHSRADALIGSSRLPAAYITPHAIPDFVRNPTLATQLLNVLPRETHRLAMNDVSQASLARISEQAVARPTA